MSLSAPRVGALCILHLTVLVGCAGSRLVRQNSLAGLQPGWNRIPGGPGTGCAQDSTFVFIVHPGDLRRLTIYFDGGGACWNGETCNVHERFFRPRLDVDSSEDPRYFAGILKLSDPHNPIRDYSIVFVPYCSGDAFLGTRTVTYQRLDTAAATTERTFQIRHQGAANAESALSWVFAHFSEPHVIFVTGSSAGAIATPFYASRLARHYPRARVVQLGDGAGGYRASAVPGNLAQWGAIGALRQDSGYRSIDSTALTFETLYAVASRSTPHVAFTQYNSAEDGGQLALLNMVGVRGVSLKQLLSANFADIRRANPRFRTYTAPGQQHTILLRPEFYTVVVDGIGFRDWVAGLLGGAEIHDVGQALLSATVR